jgi:YD repeat-containing protein
LPKGGGAIRGIGEKFAANPVTGSSSFSIPLPASPGRAGFGPQLALTYDSGSGNGPFGFGWSLGLPSITRKTNRGLPRYDDRADTFLIAGAEDLVPVLTAAGAIVDDRTTEPGFVIRRFRPRIEGLFARIERWTDASGDVHWRSLSAENLLSVYGRDDRSRIVDPADRSRVFSWLICETRDDKGNVILYDYRREDGADLDLTQAHEAHRGSATDERRGANRYIERIRYGNATTLLASGSSLRPATLSQAQIAGTRWMFEIAFDYGTADDQHPDVVAPWTRRDDPFSTCRAGFEIRTYRLCRRVLMFHRFPDLEAGARCLVRSLDLSYRTAPQAATSSDPGYSFLQSATQWSYQRNAGQWHRRALPPVAFRYSEATIHEAIRDVDPDALENLPAGLGGAYQWVDLDGEGLSGILTEQAGAWYYKPNRSSGGPGPRFGPLRLVSSQPSVAALSSGRQQLLDVQGNGALDLVEFEPPLAGFHERDEHEGWTRFVPFASLPNIDWSAADLRFVDLTGDGHADALITEHDVFTWYPSQGATGFAAAERVATALDERDGPRIVFADGEQSIFLADMSGDGLTDLVRIRNGDLCYWPNLGFGRFGAQVVMDGSPRFDHPDLFDRRRIRLADIDGSGTTDLIYLGRDGARIWFNRSGNTWSAPRRLPFPPATANVDQIQVADLLGNGTACLVWSSCLPGDERRPMRYVDLMGGVKPHLMIEMRNNLGAVTEASYAPSTGFYLQDLAAGEPWVTKLPFPVHCLERVTVSDRHRKSTFVSTYSYHHGCFDGIEREFRGFGRVEQVDTQAFGDTAAANRASGFVAQDQSLYQAPVKTITWFHTGIAADRSRILSLYEREYFPRRAAARLAAAAFAEHRLGPAEIACEGPELTPDEWREAMRACKGMVLRQETMELDLAALRERGEHVPVRLFSAGEHNCHIRRLQQRGPNQHAVFLVAESEAITYQYEISLAGSDPLVPDPRVAHQLNLRFDAYGRVQQAVAAVYPRFVEFTQPANTPAPLSTAQVELIRAVQRERHLSYVETHFTDELEAADRRHHHRLPAVCEVRSYELTGIAPAAGSSYLTPARLRAFKLHPVWDAAAPKGVSPLDYHQQPAIAAGAPDAHKRLVEHAVTRYFKADLSGPLPVGEPSPLGLVCENAKLALTVPLVDAVFAHTPAQDDFAGEVRQALDAPATPGFYRSGYQPDFAVFDTGASQAQAWWMRSGVAGFDGEAARHFFLPERYRDPFGNETTLAYDADDLFVVSSTDPLGNTVSVEAFDPRVLTPSRLRDANDNLSEVAFDIRGMPVAIAVMGKVDEDGVTETGNGVDGLDFDALNPADGEVARFFDAATLDEVQARRWLDRASSRFLYHFGSSVDAQGRIAWGTSPAGACGIVGERHDGEAPNDRPDLGLDGIPVQVAFEYSDGAGQSFVKKVQAEPDPTLGQPDGPSRWIANGKTIVNNKGKPVLQYEPYFSESGHRFEEPQAIGVSPVLYYDAPGRLVRTEHPDGSVSRVELSPWLSRSFDPNDTVLEPGNRWHAEHASAGADAQDRRAATLAAAHAGTPGDLHFDSLGREVVAVAHNRVPDAAAVPFGATTVAEWGWKDERYLTFTRLDAEGKPLWICDPRGNLVMQCIAPARPAHTSLNDTVGADYRTAYEMPVSAVPCYDIAGNLLFQHSMDAGERRLLMDAAGQPLLAWDYNQRVHPTSLQVFEEHRRFETRYDALHRPVERRLRVRDQSTGTVRESLIEFFRYGEDTPGDTANNRRGQLWQHYDGGGLAETETLDLLAQPIAVHWRLASDVEAAVVDWTGRTVDDIDAAGVPGFDPEIFTQRTTYDALGRITRQYNWHRESPAGSGESERVAVYVPGYNRRGALAKEALLVRARKTPAGHDEVAGTTRSQTAIARLDYDAKGQRLRMDCGNGTTTQYDYDPRTFRLRALRTTRPAYTPRFPLRRDELADDRVLQHLHYAYDPAGNITDIHDDAWTPAFFRNQQVDAASRYVYDALYRLIEAGGRENGGASGPPAALEGPVVDFVSLPIDAPGALRRYQQRYRYDAAGNIAEMRHLAPGGAPAEPPGWTRNYRYAPDNNRLLETWYGRTLDPALGNRNVLYDSDAHGSLLNLNATAPRFDLRWDHADMIHTIDLGGGGRAWYQYGADKQRCRKLIVRNPALNGTIKEERIYLAGYELYRRYTGSRVDDPVEEIESHHLFTGDQRVLLVDDVLRARNPRPDGLTVTAQTAWRYQYGNHIDSVGVELDDLARVISYEELHPFGTSAYRSTSSARETPSARYRYAGMERDDESQLDLPQRPVSRLLAGALDFIGSHTVGRWHEQLRVLPGKPRRLPRSEREQGHAAADQNGRPLGRTTAREQSCAERCAFERDESFAEGRCRIAAAIRLEAHGAHCWSQRGALAPYPGRGSTDGARDEGRRGDGVEFLESRGTDPRRGVGRRRTD